jgi:hypothetical protein
MGIKTRYAWLRVLRIVCHQPKYQGWVCSIARDVGLCESNCLLEIIAAAAVGEITLGKEFGQSQLKLYKYQEIEGQLDRIPSEYKDLIYSEMLLNVPIELLPTVSANPCSQLATLMAVYGENC